MKGKEETIKDYQKRINDVLMYINDHLDEKTEIEKLAGLSNFSVYHFHRIFRAYLNEPLGAFVNRLRLDRAARLLEYTDDSIGDVAFLVGFEHSSSLNKAFKKRFAITPAEFRKTKKALVPFDYIHLNKDTMDLNLKPQIKEIKDKKVVYIRSIGDYSGEGTGQAWHRICDFAKKKRLFGFSTELIGISHDDPNITEAEKRRYDACITIKKEVEPEGEVGVKIIEGGKYAIFKYTGPYSNLINVYNYIYKNWYPTSGYEFADKVCYEKYLNSPDNTKPEKLKTHIYIPLK